jgi:hypothetical protein
MDMNSDKKNFLQLSRRGFLTIGGITLAGLGLRLPAAAYLELPVPLNFDYDGTSDPFPIPWMDKNGSHNQSPGLGQEPSSIFHFRGLVARANDFTGMGTDNKGNRLAFGAPSTDFSIMEGEYFTGRTVHQGTFSHL